MKRSERDDENALKIVQLVIYQSSQNIYIGRACVWQFDEAI